MCRRCLKGTDVRAKATKPPVCLDLHAAAYASPGLHSACIRSRRALWGSKFGATVCLGVRVSATRQRNTTAVRIGTHRRLYSRLKLSPKALFQGILVKALYRLERAARRKAGHPAEQRRPLRVIFLRQSCNVHPHQTNTVVDYGINNHVQWLVCDFIALCGDVTCEVKDEAAKGLKVETFGA